MKPRLTPRAGLSGSESTNPQINLTESTFYSHARETRHRQAEDWRNTGPRGDQEGDGCGSPCQRNNILWRVQNMLRRRPRPCGSNQVHDNLEDDVPGYDVGLGSP